LKKGRSSEHKRRNRGKESGEKVHRKRGDRTNVFRGIGRTREKGGGVVETPDKGGKRWGDLLIRRGMRGGNSPGFTG